MKRHVAWSVLFWVALTALACGGPSKKDFSVHVDGTTSAGDDWPSRPQVTEPVRATFPATARARVLQTAGGGVQLVTVVRTDQPVVYLRWIVPGGRALEWAGEAGAKPTGTSTRKWPEGTTQLVADLLTMGTKTHPDQRFADALGAMGGHLEVQVLGDATVVQGRVMSHKLGSFLALVHEALSEPMLDKGALENLRRRYKAQLQSEQGDPEAVAHRLGLQAAFGADHPYSSQGPTLASLGAIQSKHIREAWLAMARLGGSTLVAVGDLDPGATGVTVEKLFATEVGRPALFPAVVLPQAATGDTCYVVDMPDAQQTALVQVAPGPPRRARIWPTLTVANQIMGGSASSRLFTDLREKRGLTYGIYSGFDGRREAGRWAVTSQLKTEGVGEALLAIDDHILGARRDAPQPEELADARRFLAGQFGLSLASPEQVAEYLAAQALYGLAEDTWQGYADALQAVTAEQVLEATVGALPAGGRISVVAGPLKALRPGLDAACRRLVARDVAGKQTAVLLGTDDEMGSAGRPAAFDAWMSAPAGLVPLARYATDPDHKPEFRAAALVRVARGSSYEKVAPIGRNARDWSTVLAPSAAAGLQDALADTDAAVQKRAHVVLLALATTRTDGGMDLSATEARKVRERVADWAFAGVDGTKDPEEIRALAEARLDAGDVAKLGDVAGEPLEQWIAADVRRLEAARALHRAGTPEARAFLVKGYRRLFQRKVMPTQDDLDILGTLPGIDAMVLLLDLHAVIEVSESPAEVRQTAAVIKTIRQLAGSLAHTRPTKGDGSSELAAQFDKVEPHLENMLALRNADDRWFAADLVIQYRGVPGLRRVLAGLSTDKHYRQERFRSVDPKRMVALLARDRIAPLGDEAESALLAGIAAPSPVGKIVAIAGLKALGTPGAIAALRTCTDETEVSAWLELNGPVTVRDLALAAVDVRKFAAEVDQLVKDGQLDRDLADEYKEIAYFTVDLGDRRLRAEVARLAAERRGGGGAAVPAPVPATQTGDLP